MANVEILKEWVGERTAKEEKKEGKKKWYKNNIYSSYEVWKYHERRAKKGDKLIKLRSYDLAWDN